MFLEPDESRIITYDTHEFRQHSDYMVYYAQRMGPMTTTPPCLHVLREIFFKMIHGEHEIIPKLIYEEPDAGAMLGLIFFHEKPEHITMLLPIDRADPGRPIIEYLKKNRTCDIHDELIEGLISLSRKCDEIYWKWKSVGSPIFRVNIPKNTVSQPERIVVA